MYKKAITVSAFLAMGAAALHAQTQPFNGIIGKT